MRMFILNVFIIVSLMLVFVKHDEDLWQTSALKFKRLFFFLHLNAK